MKNVVFYGGGNISQAVAEGLIKSGYEKNKIFYVDRNPKNKRILEKLQINNLEGNNTVKVDLFILAVKPKDAINAYKEILKKYERPKIISFVAGIKSKRYLKIDQDIEFLRAMPNTSSKFNLGITAIFNSSFKKNNLKKVISLFKRIGMTIELEKEVKIDGFTGMVGSGPAYFFYLLKSYEKKLMSLCNKDKKKVNDIMVNLMKGISLSIEKDNLDNLIMAVASKKGTTEAGLKSFKFNKLDKIFEQGLDSAIKRSREISDE